MKTFISLYLGLRRHLGTFLEEAVAGINSNITESFTIYARLHNFSQLCRAVSLRHSKQEAMTRL